MIVDLKKAIKIVRKGGIIIFPTDTAFGIGCRIDLKGSLQRLYKIRKRPKNKAAPVLFDSKQRVLEYVLPFDKKVEDLMDKFWPGALTIILKCRINKVDPLVRGGGDTLGVRVPDNEEIRRLIKEVGVPIVGTSANFAGNKTPYSFKDLDKELVDMADGVLDSTTNIQVYLHQEKNVSTVVDCTSDPWKILRQGAVKIDL